jgi:hypothetical protein
VLRQIAYGDPERVGRFLALGEGERRGDHVDDYVVQRPLQGLPSGFEDGRPRQFLVPAEVPLPSGDWGANEVYVMDGGVCRTDEGQCTAHERLFRAWRNLRQAGDRVMASAEARRER